MNLHPDPANRPIPVKAVIPDSLGTRSQRINPWIPSDRPAATICSSDAGYELKGTEIRPTQQIYRVLSGQECKRHFSLTRLDPERPAPTIVKSTGGSTTGLIHPYEIRRLTIPEAKALASYPEQFVIQGRYSERWARLGNSVPPLFMRAIAAHVRGILDRTRMGDPCAQ